MTIIGQMTLLEFSLEGEGLRRGFEAGLTGPFSHFSLQPRELINAYQTLT